MRRPLRLMLIVLVGALVILTWLGASREVIDGWNGYRLAKEASHINGLVDGLLQAGQNLAFERGRTNVMLTGPDAGTTDNLDFIAARRHAVALHLEPILILPDLEKPPQGVHFIEEYAQLRALREKVDIALRLTEKHRSQTIAREWFALTSELIDDIGNLATSLSLGNDRFTVHFRVYSRMKVQAYELRNSLGIEASHIAACVSSGHQPGSFEYEEIMYLRGKSDSIWGAIKRDNQTAGDHAIDIALLKVDEAFFVSFRPKQDAVLANLREGKPSPIPVGDLTASSIPALESIGTLLQALTRQSEQDTLRYLSQTQATFYYSVLIALLSLLTGISVVMVVIYRLFIPLMHLGNQLERLAAGDLSFKLTPIRCNDEMARGYESVLAFRDSLIKRKQLEERLMQLSNSDGLTGLANRRCLDSTLEAEWQRSIRSGQVLALAMVDVDHFKNYNDQYGHLAGDECLRRIAQILADHARRPGDLAARFGGEEFTAILPNLSADQVMDWAEGVRERVAAMGIPHTSSPEGVVTISIGVISIQPERGASVLAAMRDVDEALYRAKAEGRNRVVSGRGSR